ncbi:thiol-disulfide oxidoreductase DCC family protein [Alkalicoccobacillus porphyridii]|uniref:Thiol-disulfide oxidoreductase DCC family protein n=1 Tax=Alkalicoccobacillus porphyridii TaxID=2597270 RepID=A0A553ZUS3_9BACI|nr:thiol-disulfide oxidoreductase DCC family protein [Alkalicoccobacillus porphyridii]TSB45240.1 thiol-disulfide oxidoreductase DCC family protein [Alkalicoccobacillus porphyridii]
MNEIRGVILFDGVCNLCNNAVDFIIKRDHQRYYHFASLQSEKGKELLEKHGVSAEIDSIVVIENERAYIHDQAVLKIIPKLPFGWRVFLIAYAFPPTWRHKLYKWLARNRYRLFGKKESCRLPTQEEKELFL